MRPNPTLLRQGWFLYVAWDGCRSVLKTAMDAAMSIIKSQAGMLGAAGISFCGYTAGTIVLPMWHMWHRSHCFASNGRFACVAWHPVLLELCHNARSFKSSYSWAPDVPQAGCQAGPARLMKSAAVGYWQSARTVVTYIRHLLQLQALAYVL